MGVSSSSHGNEHMPCTGTAWLYNTGRLDHIVYVCSSSPLQRTRTTFKSKATVQNNFVCMYNPSQRVHHYHCIKPWAGMSIQKASVLRIAKKKYMTYWLDLWTSPHSQHPALVCSRRYPCSDGKRPGLASGHVHETTKHSSSENKKYLQLVEHIIPLSPWKKCRAQFPLWVRHPDDAQQQN